MFSIFWVKIKKEYEKISVVGLGYVGSAMAIVLADARNKKNFFDNCLDLKYPNGFSRINKLNSCQFPFKQKIKRFIIN